MYESTRGNYPEQTGKEAIALGMVPVGGLFVPKHYPKINWEDIRGITYPQLAQLIFQSYLPDFTKEKCIEASEIYNKNVFDSDNPAPLVNVGKMGILELWHGPTAAFKDMALQVLPHLLGESMKVLTQTDRVLILVATSGDTGKAALEGFKNVKGTEIIVFYPESGVSTVQERQMTTTDGVNTRVVPVMGNFDQCQSAVKEIFANSKLRETFNQRGIAFSSANSINWGRLLPQIVYYFWAYLQAVESQSLRPGEKMNVVVPTGNFGNILAAYYARMMGLPINKLICASNENNVLTDFFVEGIYNRNRSFYVTSSPSMDILISSNFERFLYEMSGKRPDKINNWYKQLQERGEFKVDSDTLAMAREAVVAGWASEAEVQMVIKAVYQEYSYVLDPHTAVAVKVYDDYTKKTGDKTFTIIASTASPFKFAKTVLEGIDASAVSGDEWINLKKLSEITGWAIPQGLQGLEDKQTFGLSHVRPKEISELIRKVYIS
ncbi:L-threonine synthase [Desulfitobacterium dichloroeliminans LMG P-21439]|uniref:Threonine synthase n=1 Tax=Desulfitobacterium dichloroeliminans (strain LMG P-21439 / DCA1) TaxID=871963 RepID=L0F6Y2_DESDL|nr:threonine synthase [Desulfitobacterium dichloroeliminans]AGA69569.1 L-threonine synthase [Desulfitobacterium dichloroeliminans LMG P-21439]